MHGPKKYIRRDDKLASNHHHKLYKRYYSKRRRANFNQRHNHFGQDLYDQMVYHHHIEV